MASAKPPSRIQQKNRRAILDAALDVFSSAGFRGATLDQIAAAAALSKPNLLYYFKSKEAIHRALLEDLLDSWLDPLRALDEQGDPMQEILGYVRRKLEMSRDAPRESRLFANEVLRGAPHIQDFLSGELRALVDDKAAVISKWQADGRLAPLDPHHLLFSIWSMTQHYADFEVQVALILGPGVDPIAGAGRFLETLLSRGLTRSEPAEPDHQL